MSEPPFPTLAADPGAAAAAALVGHRRVLLVGAPGTGKSTLAAGLARHLWQQRRACHCLGADPGSPAFGIPGTAGLAVWDRAGWRLLAVEALCSLDAGRFRLPLAAAVARLAARVSHGALLVDGPGVVRGVAGAELLGALVEAAAIDAILLLVRPGPVPLAAELRSLDRAVYLVTAPPQARRPGKAGRARQRTAQWDAALTAADEVVLDLDALHVIGMPPPMDVPESWSGRQLALLRGGRTIALGEALAREGSRLRARLTAATPATTLLVRDARRLADGCLGSAEPFAGEPLRYPAPVDAGGGDSPVHAPGPTGRIGPLDVALVNGVFGDPLLHARLRHRGRSLLFDLGEGARLPARVAHQVSDVFITHAHIDHISGFLWLLRARIGTGGTCRLYGPPGLAAHIAGFLRGVRWDRVGDGGPRFTVTELHRGQAQRFALQAGREGPRPLGERAAPDGLLLQDDGFSVRAAILEHVEPVLAFTFEPALELQVRKERLRAQGLAPGPWLGELKDRVQSGARDTTLALPDGRCAATGALAEDLLLITPGKKLTYATDLADSEANRRALVGLARGSHTFFCEAPFLGQDRAQAQRTAHLTARACGEIAAAAGVTRLVPFHFSRRYQADPARLYDEAAEACSRVVRPPWLEQ